MEAWDWARHQSTPVEVRREGLRPPCVRVSGSLTQCVPARALASRLGVVDPFDCGVMEPLCLPGVRRHGCAGQANYTSVTLSSSLSWLETSYYTAGWIMYRMITFSSLYGSSSLANRATDTEPPHTVSALISTCLVFPQCSTPTPLILLVLINVLRGQLK